MEIEPKTLTTCEVAPDGDAVILGFTDTSGAPAQIRLPLNRRAGHDPTRPDHQGTPFALWRPFAEICLSFSMQQELQHELGEALASGPPSAVQILAK
jgi:hypothetical protein